MNIILNVILSIGAAYCVFMMIKWDWRNRLIPDVFLFPFLLIGLLLCDTFPWIPGGIVESVVAAVIGYGVGFVVNLVFKRTKCQKDGYDPIGMGDIKLLAAGGVWLGITGLSTALMISCLTGVVWALSRKQRFVPFAPFFFAGAAIAIAMSFI